MRQSEINRLGKRRPLGIMVKSRVKSRVVYVDLIDISEGGCKIKASSGFANVGDRVTMKVGGVHAPLGKVAWIDGRYAGVAFEGEMHAAIIDHLCEMQTSDLSEQKQRFHRL